MTIVSGKPETIDTVWRAVSAFLPPLYISAKACMSNFISTERESLGMRVDLKREKKEK